GAGDVDRWLQNLADIFRSVYVDSGQRPPCCGASRSWETTWPGASQRQQAAIAHVGREIDAAFASFAVERPDALFVAARYRVPAAYGNRVIVEVGGLMSYGADFHLVSTSRRLYRQHPERGRAG